MNDQHNQNGSPPSVDETKLAQLTAYALDQLDADERGEVERLLADPSGADARKHVDDLRRLGGQLVLDAAASGLLERSADLRSALVAHLDGRTAETEPEKVELAGRTAKKNARWLPLVLAGGILSLLGLLAIPALMQPTSQHAASPAAMPKAAESRTYTAAAPETAPAYNLEAIDLRFELPRDEAEIAAPEDVERGYSGSIASQRNRDGASARSLSSAAPKENAPASVGSGIVVLSDGTRGFRTEALPSTFPAGGEPARESRFGRSDRAVVPRLLIEEGEAPIEQSSAFGTEQYDPIVDNPFLAPREAPLSTFSIDVDTASYANVRRFLTTGRLPPPSAVRIEELVNYFPYHYPQPEGDQPFSVNLEMAECPWAEGHRLLRVGLKGKEIARDTRPMSNLVFLLDTSGSMDEPNKLPLVKQSMTMLVQELTENDRVSIVTYAGTAGLVLPPTSGDQKQKILAAIENLTPGGSTHGSAGIELAYDLAGEYFREKGTNRVILATDGDLNVGITSDEALVELIKEKAKGGTFLTVLGFGEGNLKDSKMEKLADNGNGIYAYIDGAREGRKVLVEQMTGSLITIAKDVKIQIEFNPAEVAEYRLIGYENRMLAAKDFNDDKKDAGEIGAGHTVTALYEIVPVGVKKQEAIQDEPQEAEASVDPLKYQTASGERKSSNESDVPAEAANEVAANLTDAAKTGELLTVKLRYKEPDGDTSKLIEQPLKDKGGSFNAASQDMQFAGAVAAFGMVLRGSEHRGNSNLAAVEEIAGGALGKDDGGYRAEFVDLVKRARTLGVQ